MDGHYLNKEKITKSVFEWLSTAILNDTSWEGNNLHIDEVISLENINRNDWIIYSVLVFQIILDEVEIKKPYVLFLHIALSDAEISEVEKSISYSWLQNNLNEYTPPSFNCTTKEYYNQFYKHELEECFLDKSFSNYIELEGVSCFYRSHFDSADKLFSREIYFFYSTANI